MDRTSQISSTQLTFSDGSDPIPFAIPHPKFSSIPFPAADLSLLAVKGSSELDLLVRESWLIYTVMCGRGKCMLCGKFLSSFGVYFCGNFTLLFYNKRPNLISVFGFELENCKRYGVKKHRVVKYVSKLIWIGSHVLNISLEGNYYNV